MKKMLFFLIVVTCLFGCNQEEFNTSRETLKDSSEEGVKLYAQKELSMQTRGVAVNGKLWENGQTIRIKFLNGTETQQEKVKTFAQEWLQYANLTFDFVEQAENADVKIAFDWQGDHITWSMIGTDARYIPQSAPSLNFGNLSRIDRFIRRDVLMQFGHILGLVNEHQGVNNPLELDTELVYEYYLEEGWTVRDINEFFFRPYSNAETNYTEYDSESIMVWPIDPILTTNGVGQFQNSDLSELDKQFIAELYPKVDDTDYTILGVSLSESFTVDLKKVLNTTQDVFIDFGDGTSYTGSGTLIPDHVYEAGSYEIKIEADRICLNFGTLDMYSDVRADAYLKSVKFNGTTEYEYIMLGGSGAELNRLTCDPEQAPLFLQTKFSKSFRYTKLEEIPENLFANCTEATDFSNCFFQVATLKTIPEKLFYNNQEATNFVGCFNTCKALVSIPENLFINNQKATTFIGCFSFCTSLVSIPEKLFKYNPEVTGFAECFQNCTSLSGIPENLFWNNPEVTNFTGCFTSCTSITSIPENLFQNNQQATNFESCFANCPLLTSIPEKLFWNNPKARYFSFCFMGCSITNIPENLFQYNLYVMGFDNCFIACKNLTEIPENLFQNNLYVNNFRGCFSACTNLTGEAPALWERTNVMFPYECFKGAVNLSNYDQIPDNWK